jgi:hypothetical protein
MKYIIAGRKIHWMSVLSWCVVLSVTACTHLQQYADTPVQPAALEYYLWVMSLPDEAVSRELDKLKQQQGINPIIHQVQLALLLTASPGATPEDEALALTALEQVSATPETSPGHKTNSYRLFALLWQDIIKQHQHRRQLNSELQETVRKIQALEEEKRLLSEQIEALKSIEQQINNRVKHQDNKP